jgi:pilus assembly protein CpaC
MKAGHTLALAGDYREDVQTEVTGIPKLMDSPFIGPLFRKVKEEKNETELVFLITPRFISEVEPHRVPRLGPGQLTTSPSDRELYLNGYTEVPRCTVDCPTNDRFDDPRSTRNENLLPTYNNAAPTGMPQQPAMNSYQAPVVPQIGTNQRVPAARQAKKSTSGFSWPGSKRR